MTDGPVECRICGRYWTFTMCGVCELCLADALLISIVLLAIFALAGS